jgi:PAS domain S-box-containing protein
MIVEDEGLIAHDIAGSVERIGHVVAGIASSGSEALALLEHSLPDLILMDIRLQGDLDGIDLALKVRLQYNIPIVFLTSHADSATLQRAKQAEPYGYLTKPFLAPTLGSTIEMALYKHQGDQGVAQREAWLSSVLYTTPAPTIVTDGDGRILMLSQSAERLLGCSLAEVQGTTWTVAVCLFDEDTGAELEDLAVRAMAQFKTSRLPKGTLLRKAGGGEISVEGEIAPRLSQGQTVGAIVTIRDTTQRNEEERFRRQEQKMFALGQLANAVAHEVDDHLAAIRRHGEAIADALPKGASVEPVLALLYTAATAGDVTERLLTLGGNMVLTAELVNVNESILRTVDRMTPDHQSAITVHTSLDPGGPSIRMKCEDFDQILVHLLTNAYQAMPNGGGVTISTSVLDRHPSEADEEDGREYVRITVRDSGTGLTREAQDHLFEPYFTTREPGEGEGLGLSIVHGLVTRAAGTIVASSTPYVGASFDLYLPTIEHLPSLSRSVQPPEEIGLLPSQATRSWTKANLRRD